MKALKRTAVRTADNAPATPFNVRAGSAPKSPPPFQQIAERAYYIYLSQGCPCGEDQQHWLEAEAQLTLQARLTESSNPPEDC